MDHLHTRPKEFHTFYITSDDSCAEILCTKKIDRIRIRLGLLCA